jgi:hypothetical protein
MISSTAAGTPRDWPCTRDSISVIDGGGRDVCIDRISSLSSDQNGGRPQIISYAITDAP